MHIDPMEWWRAGGLEGWKCKLPLPDWVVFRCRRYNVVQAQEQYSMTP